MLYSESTTGPRYQSPTGLQIFLAILLMPLATLSTLTMLSNILNLRKRLLAILALHQTQRPIRKLRHEILHVLEPLHVLLFFGLMGIATDRVMPAARWYTRQIAVPAMSTRFQLFAVTMGSPNDGWEEVVGHLAICLLGAAVHTPVVAGLRASRSWSG